MSLQLCDNGMQFFEDKEYMGMEAIIELLTYLAKADEDVNCGRVAPMKDTFDNLRNLMQTDNSNRPWFSNRHEK
uniref:Uncharacterized protein n=1 Tax=Eubacterium cellulosolvens (strain ATCC 43171 / JCM 9499 / 6) TaxID=633697 RepID=I5AQ82_EUBC6